MDQQVIHRTFASFILSKKLWGTVFSLLVVWFAYWKEVDYLYSFTTPEQINAFSGISRDFMFTFTAIVLGFLGIDGVVSWKHGTETILNQAVSTVTDNLNKKEDITNTSNLNEHIIEEGANGAPLVRPFSQLASQEEGCEDGY